MKPAASSLPCKAQVQSVCTGRAEHWHHVKTRARGGSDDLANQLPVCLRCHDWIHGHPEAAEILGLLEHSWG